MMSDHENCTTHHNACDCREHQREVIDRKLRAQLASLKTLAGATKVVEGLGMCVAPVSEVNLLLEFLKDFEDRGTRQSCGCDGALDFGCINCSVSDRIKALDKVLSAKGGR